MPDNLNKRMRYTRQSIISNTFYQMPRFLTAGEFAGNNLSNNARILYVLLLDRHKLSVKNDWFDDNGEVYIYFKREEMESQLGLSERTISKVMQELKDLSLIEEKKQGLNKPNKIYLLSPVIGDDENPAPYLDPYTDCEPEITADSDAQDLPLRTGKNYASEPVNITGQDPQDLSPNNNKLNKNKNNKIYMSNNELNKTAAADTEPPLAAEEAETQIGTSPSIPYSQIIEMYNALCETTGLRPINSINGKRKTQTAARFKEYGLSGFVDLFAKVSASAFLCGGGGRGWKADYDWLTAPTNMQKVLEGKYDNDQSNTPVQQSQILNTQNNQERHDPFLERAMVAYETATRTTTQ